MGRSLKDSLKVLEADIQLANTLAFCSPKERDGAHFQMRLSFSPVASMFPFLLHWFDCQVAGALGLLHVLIYMAYADGTTTMSVQERKASIREFYGTIFPSLLQLQRGITDLEDKKQKKICSMWYTDTGNLSETDIEREEECGICMELNSKVILPMCSHSMCLKCYRDWRSRSQSCPFCRSSLKRVNSGDLWVLTDRSDIVDLPVILRENLQRLYVYIEKLPFVLPQPVFSPLNAHDR